MPAKSASDLGLPSLSAKAISGRSSGFGLSKSGAIGPLFRPARGPLAVPCPDDPDPESSVSPLSEGAKLTYTVPNPAIAATIAATR